MVPMKHVFYGWWVVLACVVTGFCVAGTIFYGFTAYFEPLVAEFGWSYTQISFAASLRGMEMGVLAPVVGFMVDRLGSRKILLSGIFLTGLGLVVLGNTSSLVVFYGAFLLIGCGGGGCTSVVTMTAVANWFDTKAGKALGIMTSGFGLSGVMLPLIVFLIDAYGWRVALMILGIGLWAICLPLGLIVRDRPEQYGYSLDGDQSGREAASQAAPPGVRENQNFSAALRDRSFLLVALGETIRFLALATLATHIMPYLSTMEFDRGTAATLAAAVPIVSVIGRFGFGWLSDFFPRNRLMALSFVFILVGLLALSCVNLPGMVVVFIVTTPIGFGGGVVLRGTVVRACFGRDIFGKLIGIVMGTAAIGGIVGPTLAGWVFDTTGGYRLFWLVLSALIGTAALTSLGIRK